jgi:hypothetical protein
VNDLRAPTVACSQDNYAAGIWEELLRRLTALHSSPEPNAKVTFDGAYQKLLASRGPLIDPAEVDCLVSVAHYFYLQADIPRGTAAAELAVAHARKLGDVRRLRKTLTIAHGKGQTGTDCTKNKRLMETPIS